MAQTAIKKGFFTKQAALIKDKLMAEKSPNINQFKVEYEQAKTEMLAFNDLKVAILQKKQLLKQTDDTALYLEIKSFLAENEPILAVAEKNLEIKTSNYKKELSATKVSDADIVYYFSKMDNFL
jgi:uncharacterized protein YaeQ